MGIRHDADCLKEENMAEIYQYLKVHSHKHHFAQNILYIFIFKSQELIIY